LENGNLVETKTIKVNAIKPQQAVHVDVKFEHIKDSSKEYFINFYAFAKYDAPLIKKGYQFGTEQFLLQKSNELKSNDKKNEVRHLTKGNTQIIKVADVIFKFTESNKR
jgi:hypothetical protein